MVRNFFSTPNVLGRLLIILLFAGGVVFAGAFDGFVVETEASSCCGGGIDDAIFSSSSNNNGDGDGDPESGCSCLNGGPCGECETPDCDGTHERYCHTNCSESEADGCYCTTTDCDKTSEQACYSACQP